MTKRKNGKNKGKITRERNKILELIRLEKLSEERKLHKKTYNISDPLKEETPFVS